MKHCSDCDHFHLPYGESKGFCYGLPPAMYQSGNQQVNPPMVKANRPYCSCFTPLPADTTTNAKGKVDADTPGDAAKQAYEAKHIPVTFAAEKKPEAVPVTVVPPATAATAASKKGRR